MKYPFVKMNILQYLVDHGELTGYSFMLYCKKRGIPASNGTIYPHLKDLERGGLIQSQIDGKRKRYTLTKFGEDWIKNSTNTSMPSELIQCIIRLYRAIDMAKWEDAAEVQLLIEIVDEIKVTLTNYTALLRQKGAADSHETGK